MTASRAEFIAGLPRKVVAAGALVTDGQGRVLLVRPTYKPGWEIPGGCVEDGESAPEACARELAEELAVILTLGRLLVVQHQSEPEGDSIMFVYDGGSLEGIEGLTLLEAEVAEARFVEPSALVQHLTPAKAARMNAALRARSDERVIELIECDDAGQAGTRTSMTTSASPE